MNPRNLRNRRRPILENLEGRQLLSLGPEFSAPVNTTLVNTQFESANASSANGASVAVWTNSLSFTDHDIRAQRFNAAGQKTGPEIIVNTGTLDDFDPAVAMDRNGDFVVAWTQNQGNGDTNVLAQRFNPNGTPAGGIVGVGVGTFREHNPSVAMDDHGDFVVAYTRDTNNNNPDIFAKLYNVNNQLTNVVSVATTPLAENNASVAMTPDGRFDVAWELSFSATDHDIHMNEYTAGGGFLRTSAIANDTAFESVPSVSMDNAGNAVVAWQQRNNGINDIMARRVSAAGVMSNVTPIAQTSVNATNPSVALERTGGAYVVVYDNAVPTGSHAIAAEVTASNHVTSIDAGNRFNPAVSINGANNYLVTYTSDDNGDLNIRRRIGHL